MSVKYSEIKPSKALEPYVDSYWLQTFDNLGSDMSQVQSCPPFGMTELIVHLDDCHCEVFMDGTWSRLPKIFLAGIYREPVLWRSPGNTRKFGIRLKPETFHMLFRASAATLFQDYTSFENIEKGAAPFAERISEAKSIAEVITLTEAFLMEQLAKNRIDNNYLVQAANIIRSSKGDISIEEVSRSVAVSTRQLQRSFKDCFGTSPKTYLRIIRFSNAYRNLLTVEEQGGWAGLSYSLGYADQAHFIREFKEFTGTIPRIMLLNENQVFGKVS